MTKDDLWRMTNLHTDDRHTDVRELVEKHRLHSILVTTGATQVLQQGNYTRLWYDAAETALLFCLCNNLLPGDH